MKAQNRKEIFLKALANGKEPNIKPLTREEVLLAKQAKRESESTGGGGASSWNDLEPFETVGGDTLTWDGNTEGLETDDGQFYKVTDIAPSIEAFANGGSVTVNTGDILPFTSAEITEFDAGFTVGEYALIGANFGTRLLAVGGNYISSLTINGYTGFTTTKLKEEYIPVDYIKQLIAEVTGN